MFQPTPRSTGLRRSRRRLAVALLTLTIVALVAGCGGGSSSSSTSASGASSTSSTSPAAGTSTSSGATVEVGTKNVAGLGTILVNAKGQTLYMFAPDKAQQVTCTDQCAAVWPPLELPDGGKAVASGAAKSKLLDSDPNPAGGQVVTYAGWPLYTYVADSSPGQATGQALNLNGGLWYVLSPSGKVIHTKP